MAGMDRAGDLTGARSLADEILRLEPDSVRFHQKRVEYAFRCKDKPRLAEAYLELADCLMRAGEMEKASAVYRRVRELSPKDSRADAALGAVSAGVPAPPAAPPSRPAAPATPRGAPAQAAPAAVAPVAPEAPAPAQAAGDYVDLSAWLYEDEQPRSTRMVVYGVTEPEDGQQADFEEMLERFKQGVAANIDDADHQSHYDLGIAYREMGLLDEAIAELQKALRTTGDRVKTYEALGQCFVDKGQHQVAVALLSHALADNAGGDQTLVGILYLLGQACESLRRYDDARAFFERVFAIDLQFRDVRERLAALERAVS
jgi:tetratricopeptide (TPR) repeat protein